MREQHNISRDIQREKRQRRREDHGRKGKEQGTGEVKSAWEQPMRQEPKNKGNSQLAGSQEKKDSQWQGRKIKRSSNDWRANGLRAETGRQPMGGEIKKTSSSSIIY
jgi:hypothetical protein